MTTMWQGGPPASPMRAATAFACQSASWLPRVPRRRAVVGGTASARPAVPGPKERLDTTGLLLALGLFFRLLLREPEQSRERLGVRADRLRVAERFQLLGRRQQQLLDDEVRDLVDARARLRRKGRHLELEPLELCAPDRLEALPQRNHGWNRAARSKPGAEALDFLADDRFGPRHFAGAAREVLPHGRLQIVDVVEKHLLDFAGGRFDV